MSDKIMYIKAVEGSRIHTMDLPVSETARAADVCQNLYEKCMHLRSHGYKNIDIIYGYPVYCVNCEELIDVDPKLEGVRKYCKICEIKAINLVMFDQMNQKSA